MKTQLNMKQRLLVAMTLFGMFFGAGNLIFPVHLGQIAGNRVFYAMIGFIITAVGIPILGVAAIGNTHSDGLQSLSSKVGNKYGIFFTTLLYLTIGPFFAIPRCATTSFTTGIAPMVQEETQSLILFIFSLVFFGLVLFYSLRPSKITVWIGKIINPIFLIFLTILVLVALLNPSTSVSSIHPMESYANLSGALFSGFIEGYGTMDAIAGLAFGIVVIDIIKSMGINDDATIAKEVLISGIMTGILMAIIYIATIIMGVQSRGLFEISENGGIALAQIANHYLGQIGSIVLAITITSACLKTSIGLVTSISDAFSRMFPEILSYDKWTYIFTIFSFIISNFGLSKIIEYSLPVLMFLYPLTITLIILALVGKKFNHDKTIYISVTAFTFISAIFDLIKTLPEGVRNTFNLNIIVDLGNKILPWYNINLGWIIPALLGLFIGLILKRKKGLA